MRWSCGQHAHAPHRRALHTAAAQHPQQIAIACVVQPTAGAREMASPASRTCSCLAQTQTGPWPSAVAGANGPGTQRRPLAKLNSAPHLDARLQSPQANCWLGPAKRAAPSARMRAREDEKGKGRQYCGAVHNRYIFSNRDARHGAGAIPPATKQQATKCPRAARGDGRGMGMGRAWHGKAWHGFTLSNSSVCPSRVGVSRSL